MKKAMVFILALGFVVTACTAKKRDEAWSQGQGENAEEIAQYDGKTFPIQTLTPVGDKALNTSNAESTKIKVVASQVKALNFPLVLFKSDAKLLGEVPFKGRADTTDVYQALYKVSDNFLKVYKVATAENIPLDEQTYAETDIVPGKLAVPLVGYPIKGFFNADNVRNDNNEATSKLSEKSLTGRSGAKYFRIDYNGRVLFEAITKTNLFPKQLFLGQLGDGSDNDWFFSETIISAPAANMEEIGSGDAQDQELRPSSRVKFVATETMLKVVNMNIDARLKLADDVNFSTVLLIPIEWKAFKVKKRGTDKEMSESEDSELHWQNRPYAKVNLEGSQPIKQDMQGRVTYENNPYAKLVELELVDNYFSFTVQKHNSNTKVRYSFLRASTYKDLAKKMGQEYIPKTYFDKDQKKFGFFTTQKSTVQNYEIRRKEDINQNIFISRFNPKAGEIKFYFTETSPKCSERERQEKTCLRDWARVAVKSWNEAFTRGAGVPIKVSLDETGDDKKLGDLRYNTINLIDSLVGSDLYGFGPSITDPFTGEIIAATTNIHVSSMRTTLIDSISDYVRMKQGQLDGNYLFNVEALKTFGVHTAGDIPLSVDGAGQQDKLKLFSSQLMTKERTAGKYKEFLAMSKKSRKNYGVEFDLGLSTSNLIGKVERQCPEVGDYLKSLNSNKQAFGNNEKQVFLSCANRLLGEQMLGTLIHEMGHNFGLRHNFRASTDWKNFYTAAENGGKLARSSSVMEYTHPNEERPDKPGRYDIAAIKFGYANKVELATGRDLPLDTSISIEENLLKSGKGNALKTYFYCTDEDVDYYAIDPLCRRHDAGITPKEIVEIVIKDYNSEVATLNHRYDKIYPIYSSEEAGVRLAKSRMRRYLSTLSGIYEQWRSQLARYTGYENRYLENYSATQYDQILEKMKVDPEFGAYYAAYKPAVDLIFDFLTKVADLPVKYCVSKKQDGSFSFDELEMLRDSSVFLKSVYVSSCSDAAIQSVIGQRGLTYVTEIGHFSKDAHFDTAAESVAKEPLDVIGTFYDRALAIVTIGSRTAQSIVLSQRGDFQPGFLDEPQYRDQWMNISTNRLMKGIEAKSLLAELKSAVPNYDFSALAGTNLLKFKSERKLIELMLETLKDGIAIPGKEFLNQQRLVQFSGFRTTQEATIQSALSKADLGGGVFYVVMDKRSVRASEMVDLYNKIISLKDDSAANRNEQLQKLIPELMKFANLLPESKNQAKYPFKDLNAAMNQISRSVSELSEGNAKLSKEVLGDFFATFAQLTQAVTQKYAGEISKSIPSEILKKLNDKQDLSEAEQAQLNQVVSGFLDNLDVVAESAKLGIKSFPLSREAYQNYLTSKNAAFNDPNGKAEKFKYMENKDEIDSQFDILTSQMNSMPQL